MMTDEIPEDRLEAVLISVGQHLVLPAEVEVARLPSLPVRRRRASRLLVAASVALLGIAVGLLVPPARAAIADLLGIGSTGVEVDPTLPAETDESRLPRIVDGLVPISATEAAAVLGTDVPSTNETALGPPDSFYPMPEGGVLLAWPASEATLWLRSTVEGIDVEALFTKLVGIDQTVEQVEDLGSAALFIGGSHLLQTPHRRLEADSVLLWTDPVIDYRLEANLSRTEMIDVARAVTP